MWLRGRDLNPRPLGYEPNELPDCSTPRQISISDLKSQTRDLKLVGLGRVELPTSRLSGVRSNQLSYRPLHLFHAIFRAKKSHTSLLRSVFAVDALEGRVASVAKYCLRSTFLPNCKRTKKPSDLRFQI